MTKAHFPTGEDGEFYEPHTPADEEAGWCDNCQNLVPRVDLEAGLCPSCSPSRRQQDEDMLIAFVRSVGFPEPNLSYIRKFLDEHERR